jgi:hypothetical protein
MTDATIRLTVKIDFAYGDTKEQLKNSIEEFIKNGYTVFSKGHIQPMIKIGDSDKVEKEEQESEE